MRLPQSRSFSLRNGSGPEPYRLLPSVRLCCCLLITLATVCVNLNYATLNFTLICMINATTWTSDSESRPVTEQNCPQLFNSSDSIGPVSMFDGGDIGWSRVVRANVQAAYSYTMIFMNLPYGLLVHRYGAKKILIISQILSATACFLFPTTAYISAWAAFICRLLGGAAGGVCWPTILYFATKWSPERNAGFLMTLAAAGFPLGTILAFVVSGQVCALGVRGWQYTYYFGGSLSVLCAILFQLLFSNDPLHNRFISQRELQYILTTRNSQTSHKGSTQQHQKAAIPWKHILTSGPVFGIMSSSFCLAWTFYYVGTFIPTYMKEVLVFDVRSNGFLSALPNMSQFCGRLLFGTISDNVGRRFNRTLSVKLFDAFALSTPAIMFIIISFQDCTTASVAIVCFTLGHFFIAANTAGYLKSQYYIAPQYVGIVSAMCGTAGSLPAVIVPYAIGWMTRDGTISQWRSTQYLTSGLLAFGVVVFAILGSGKEQEWAIVKHEPPAPDTCVKTITGSAAIENGSANNNNCDKQNREREEESSDSELKKFQRLNSYGQPC